MVYDFCPFPLPVSTGTRLSDILEELIFDGPAADILMCSVTLLNWLFYFYPSTVWDIDLTLDFNFWKAQTLFVKQSNSW